MSEERISCLEKEVSEVKLEIIDIKNSFSLMLESFKEDTDKILSELEGIKKLHHDKMIDIIELTNSLLLKVQRVKGGIDKFQSEILRPNDRGKR